MRAAVLLLVAGLMPTTVARADQPFWICIDAQFNKTVQDAPCAYAPEAPPSGSAAAVVPERAQARVPAARTPPSASRSPSADELDAGRWWQQQWSRAQKWIEDRGGLDALLRNPWLHAAAGLIALLLALRWALRELLPRWRARQRERAAGAQPDAYRHAHGQDPRSAKKQQPVAASAPEASPELPMRWTPALLRSLNAAQFAHLCQRLWQLRGMQVEADGCEGDALLLRRAAGAGAPHGVVLIRGAAAEPLGSRAVRELLGLMSHHGCEYGVLMTPSEFNTEARNFVRGKSMELKGWMTLMTELEAMSDAPRGALLAEIFGGASASSAAADAMLAS